MQLPSEDRYSMDKERILDTIAVLFGGRIAEEIFMHQMTTGASNDFERATAMARRMVTQWGMSDALGTMVYGENEGEVFLGRSVTTHKNISEATMQKVDAEIRRIIDQQYALARGLIEANRDKIEAMTKALLEWETIDADQINDIMAGNPPRPPKPPAPSSQVQQPPQDQAPPARCSNAYATRAGNLNQVQGARLKGQELVFPCILHLLSCLLECYSSVVTSNSICPGLWSWASSTSRPIHFPMAGDIFGAMPRWRMRNN